MADITYKLNFTGDQINNLLTRTNNLDTELNNYLLKNGGDMNGAINMNGQSISGLGEPTEDSHAVPKFYADNITEIANSAKNTADSALPKSGGTMTGAINMNGQSISGLNDPTEATQAARKAYVDLMLPKSGGTMTGSITMGGNKMTGLGTPTATGDAATKEYVDGKRFTKTATITTEWAGIGPYSQNVSVPGILASDMPHVTPVLYADAYAVARVENWQKISMAEAVADGIKFTCFEEKPTMELGIQIEVMR